MTLTAAFWAAASLLTANIDLVAAESTFRAAGVLFGETFDDARLTERGWYDGRTFAISREGTRAGGGCIEYRWKSGTTTPERSSGLRRPFEPTDTVYLRFYIKLSPGWGWTGRSYHPHLMHVLTTENDKYHGPAASHLTLYIEPQRASSPGGPGHPESGQATRADPGPLRGGYNGTFYDSKDVLFTDDAWHCVEAMFKLNSLDPDRDLVNRDGIVRGWFDGKLVLERTDIVLRSTDFPNMKFNQFLLAPTSGPACSRTSRPCGSTSWRSGPSDSGRSCRRPAPPRPPQASPESRRRNARGRGPAQESDHRLPAAIRCGPGRGRSLAGGTGATRPQGRRGRMRRAGAPGGHPGPPQMGNSESRVAERGPPRGGPPDARPARQGGGGPPHVSGPVQRRHRNGRSCVQHLVPARPRRQGDRPLSQGQPANVRAESRTRPPVPVLPDARTWGRWAC